MNVFKSVKAMKNLIAEAGVFNVFKRAVPMTAYARKIGCRIYRNGSCFLWNDKEKFDLLFQKEQADYWSKQVIWTYKEHFPKRYGIMHKFLKDNLWSKLDRDAVVIDLPCGTGEWTFEAADYAGYVEGYEYSEGMVATAKENALKANVKNVSFTQADATKIRFEKKYDYFMLLGLLTCIYDEGDAEKIVSNVADAVNEGGLLVTKDSLHEEDRRESLYTYSVLNGYTAVYRSKKEYYSLFEKYGFEMVKEEYLAREKMVMFHYCSVITLWRKKNNEAV